jgi:hypothetical protein
MRFMRFSFILALFLVAFSCRKDNQPAIPYVYVNLIIYPDLSTKDYIPVGGYKYFNGGYKGIVVYRMLTDEFRVYERCCPYDPEKANAQITVNSDNITAVDSCCMSHYILLDGSPYGNGPSPYSLMTYNYSYDGEKLLIYN